MKLGLSLFGSCGCPNPAKYLYILNDKQHEIISSHFEEFSDIKYLTLRAIDFSFQEKTYTVQCGFATDGVSSGLVCSNWIDIDSSIKHDFLYAIHPADRATCDRVLSPFYRRWAVSLFGTSAWEASGVRGALLIKRDIDTTKLMVYHNADCESCSQFVQLSKEDGCTFDSFFEEIKI